MSAGRNTAAKNFVLGLGATGLSIARYLRRNDIEAMFFDTRDEPPGVDELERNLARAEHSRARFFGHAMRLGWNALRRSMGVVREFG